MNLELVLSVVLVSFISALIRVVFGFGNALIAMPLLAMTQLSMKEVTPLVALIAQTMALYMLVTDWRHVRIRSTWRLVLSSLSGIPLGIMLLTLVTESLVKLFLALFLLGFSLLGLIKPQRAKPVSDLWSYPFGFLSGILGGAYNVNGPPVVVYGTLKCWSPDEFRATLQGYFFPTGILIVSSHAAAGLWTPRVGWLYLLAVPSLVLAVVLGNRLCRALPAHRFEIGINLLLIIISLTLIAHVIFSG